MSAKINPLKLPMQDDTFYPDSDGKPMGETPAHVRNMRWAIDPIDTWFADDPHVFVAANMFLYFVEGNPKRHVSPDLFVVKGIPKEKEAPRRSYRTWEENGKGPDVVIEFTSRSTRREDMQTKMTIYRDTLGVSEYFLFDPHDEYLRPRLQGYRLSRGRYVEIKPVKGRLPSNLLALHLEADGELLRFFDPATATRLPIPPEIQEALKQSEESRRRSDEEIERLRQELKALRRQLPGQ